MGNYGKIAESSVRFCDSQNHNRSNGGVAFVFVEIFGLSTRLKSVEVQKFLQVRNCISQNKLYLAYSVKQYATIIFTTIPTSSNGVERLTSAIGLILVYPANTKIPPDIGEAARPKHEAISMGSTSTIG